MNVLNKIDASFLPFTIKKCLGAGADGEAYSIHESNDKVLKLSIIKDFYNISPKDIFNNRKIVTERIIDSKEDIFVNFSPFVQIPLEGEEVAYYYTMDLLQELSQPEVEKFGEISSQLTKQDFSSFINQFLYYKEDEVANFFRKIKLSRFLHDTHVRNIMKTSSGKYKLIDLDRVDIKGKIFYYFQK